jgi:chromosome segregation and condensation protein ScpB
MKNEINIVKEKISDDIIVYVNQEEVNISSLLNILSTTQLINLKKQVERKMKSEDAKYDVKYLGHDYTCTNLEEISELCGKSISTVHRVIKRKSNVKGLDIKLRT